MLYGNVVPAVSQPASSSTDAPQRVAINLMVGSLGLEATAPGTRPFPAGAFAANDNHPGHGRVERFPDARIVQIRDAAADWLDSGLDRGPGV